MCQMEMKTWSQTYAWVSVSRKQMSKCNCRQAHTRPYTHSSLIQVGTWGHVCTQSQILNICRNSVWSQQQSGTILLHSIWCWGRSQVTASHKTMSFSLRKHDVWIVEEIDQCVSVWLSCHWKIDRYTSVL